MKSMQPPSAAIFFMTYFHRALAPLDPLLGTNRLQFSTNPCYHPQRSCRKVMFLHLSVSHSVQWAGGTHPTGMHPCTKCLFPLVFIKPLYSSYIALTVHVRKRISSLSKNLLVRHQVILRFSYFSSHCLPVAVSVMWHTLPFVHLILLIV